MKKFNLNFILVLLVLLGCQKEEKFPAVRPLSSLKATSFVPTLEHKINPNKNNIYAASLLLAWDEIRNEINDEIHISNTFPDLQLLNQSTSYQNVLNKDEYRTSVDIVDNIISAKAEFSKSLSFETKLNPNQLTFNGQKVKAFGVSSYSSNEQLQLVKILYYKNDKNFIIKLLPKDTSHEIILFKSEKKWNTMTDINREISKLIQMGTQEKAVEKTAWKYYFNDEDEVVIPNFSFNLETHFKTLENTNFSTTKQDYIITKAWQRNAFILNEKGAEVESEATMEMACEAIEKELPQPKKMIFNEPFFLMLKKTTVQNPYFCIWVKNTELMEKE